MNFNINSLYICVTNMERALNFYETFFEKAPLVKDKIYSVFEINHFRFGLFAYQEMGESHTFGNNCLPSIEVDSIEELNYKTRNLAVCFPLTHIGNNWVMEFIDSEGNHIELTTPTR